MTTTVDQAPLSMATLQREPGDLPKYCPICGRWLDYAFWDTVDGDRRYHAMVCFGSHSRLWKAVFGRLKVIWPAGLHYRYEWGPTRIDEPRRFDTKTGRLVS